MHACDDDTYHVSTGRRAFGARDLLEIPGRFVRSILANAARRGVERKAAQALLSMDEYLLRDIGVTRGDAERLVRGERPATRR